MPVYFLVGPAAALIGIVAILFVMRNRQTQKKSMYSSRRSQIERKVKAARQRTLAPRGRSDRAPTAAEIAAAVPSPAAPVYEAPPAAPRQAWETPATPPPPPPPPPPAYAPAAAPEYAPPPEYTPPPAPEFSPAAASAEAPVAPAPFAEPPAPSQPEWTPSPAAPEWNPAPAAADVSAAAEAPAAAPEPVSTPAGEGASWEIVGSAAAEPAAPERGRGKKEKSDPGTSSPWQLASGDAPGVGEDGEDEPRKPNATMAIAQYAVLVVGLVMVLIGVLVMVANSKVT